MVDFKYETRPYAPRFPDLGQQNRIENVQIPPHISGYYPSFEDENIGGCGDRLFDLECRLATSLSKELLSALDAPTQQPLPDFERNKVACLKNAILELKRENDALHRELWRAEFSQSNEDDRKKEPELCRPQSVGGPVPNGRTTRGSERDVACQTASPSLKIYDRTSKSRGSVAGSTAADPGGKSHPQVSSHSKCVDWLSLKKSFGEKRDDLHLVRLALRQLWELADSALTHGGQSNESLHVECPENATGDDADSEEKEHIRTNPSLNEIDQLRLQLVRLQRSKDRLKHRRDEQTLLLRQKEMQVSRLQRSRQNLSHTFKNQLILLRHQHAVELKALQLQMQTERASALAGQTAEMEEQLQRAVEQLEERYRGLLREAYNEKKKDPLRNQQQSSLPGQGAREESGT